MAEEMSLHPEEVIAARQTFREEAKAARREWDKFEAECQSK
jgi:hypothetical protein